MKKHSSQALIGALALILGCVIFLTALIGLTTANSRVCLLYTSPSPRDCS